MKFNESTIKKLASGKRKYALVFQYATGTHAVNDVLSTHSTYELARAAAQRSGYDSFLAVRDCRDYL